MIVITKCTEFVSAPLAIAAAFLLLVSPNTVHAQALRNGSFEVPDVSGDTGGLVHHDNPALNGPNVLWGFPFVPGGDSGITVDGPAGFFGAPTAPEGKQTAWVQNLGAIFQPFTVPPGKYELSFQLARRTYGCSAGSCGDSPSPEPILVWIGNDKHGPYTAASATSFDKVTIPFEFGTDPLVLKFIGTGPALVANQEDHVAYIDAVSIKPVPPEIVSGPSDIDPNSFVVLEGKNFGFPAGHIEIAFPKPSAEPFSKANGSKTEFRLDTVGVDTSAQSAFPIDIAHPQGAVDGQTVDITVAAADGSLKSNVWHAYFHNKAVIASGPNTITPGQSFLLKGWDFDNKAECSSEKTGTVTVRFSDKTFPHGDLVLPIPGSGCLADAIKVDLPRDTSGVVAQTVQIIYESPGGRKSTPWPAQFAPKLETKILPWQDVVVTCGNESTLDSCNDLNSNPPAGVCFDSIVPWGITGFYPPEDTMIAQHWGCFGISSNDGTDSYVTNIAFGRGWSISPAVDVGALANNASFSDSAIPQTSAGPIELLFVQVNWHIGATGGEIFYNGDIYITGPTGVPFE